jgi:hypothetical protein
MTDNEKIKVTEIINKFIAETINQYENLNKSFAMVLNASILQIKNELEQLFTENTEPEGVTLKNG